MKDKTNSSGAPSFGNAESNRIRSKSGGVIKYGFTLLLVISLISTLINPSQVLETKTLESLLSYFSNLEVMPVSWYMRYYELGTWPSYLNWLLTFFEVVVTIINYIVSIILLALQAITYLLGFLAWVFA